MTPSRAPAADVFAPPEQLPVAPKASPRSQPAFHGRVKFRQNVLQMLRDWLRDWNATELEAWQLHDAAVGNVLEGFLTIDRSGRQLDVDGELLPCVRCVLQELRGNAVAKMTVAEEYVFRAHNDSTYTILNPHVAAACLDYLRELAA